jgi:hypothetical protein
MPWTVFDKRAATASKSPMVTIQRGGHFSLNKAAYRAVGEPEAVEILFDPAERLIGFRPASPESPRSFPVKGQGRDAPTTFMVAGQAFAKYNELDVSTARRYGVKVDEDGILVLDLKGPSIDVTGPRAMMKSRLADRELTGNDKATKQA